MLYVLVVYVCSTLLFMMMRVFHSCEEIRAPGADELPSIAATYCLPQRGRISKFVS
jgi:hypothetical protein